MCASFSLELSLSLDLCLSLDLSLSIGLVQAKAELNFSLNLVQAKAGQKLKLVQAKLAKNNCMADFWNILIVLYKTIFVHLTSISECVL